MAEIVPLRPSVIEAAHNISIKFAKVDNAHSKARSLRVEIGFELIDLKRRVDAGEAAKVGEPEEFWAWIKMRVNRSVQDMRKCIALAKAKDPEAAAAQERDDNRGYQQKSRAQKAERADSQRPAQVESFDRVERAQNLVRSMSEDERERFFVWLEEEFK